jgi:hypothetical protein
MYTFHMSWPFRAWALALVLSWGLIPQLACFMPDQAPTQQTMNCCQGMAGDCSSANMSQACCQTVVRANLGITAKVVRDTMPRLNAAATVTEIAPDFSINFDPLVLSRTAHAPPDKTSPSILRI